VRLRRASPALAPDAPTRAATTPPPVAPPTPDAPDVASVADALSAELDRRTREIVASVPPVARQAAGLLADAVSSEPASAVRQLPSAARDALAVCDDPRAGVADLARVCEADLAVAQGLLRYANSALVARAGQSPAASLREAIDRVGAAGVRNVVVDVTVAALLCAPGTRTAGYTAQIWTHAQRTAALARALAPAFGVAPDRAYAAGLLHDVGKLVLLDRAAVLASSGAKPPPWPALRALLLGLHEPLGALAVLRWGMGAEAGRAVGAHHRAPTAAPHPLGEAVYLAERADLALVRGEALDLATWWEAGAIGAPRERAAALLHAHLGPLAAAGADTAPHAPVA
jgi:HD-like signal output (HDOD) protein